MNETERLEAQRWLERSWNTRLEFAKNNMVCPVDMTPSPGGGLCQNCLRMRGVTWDMPKFPEMPLFTTYQNTDDAFRALRSELGDENPNPALKSLADAAASITAIELGDPRHLQYHVDAPAMREALEVTGIEFQSAHIVPQAVYRCLGLDPGQALTTLLPVTLHHYLDFGIPVKDEFVGGWVSKWNEAVSRKEDITAGQVYKMISDAIEAITRRKPGDSGYFSDIEANILQWKLYNELFSPKSKDNPNRGLGLQKDTIIRDRLG